MIVIDTSAVLAIYWNDAETAKFLSVIDTTNRLVIAAPNAVELYLVMTGRQGVLAGEQAMLSLS